MTVLSGCQIAVNPETTAVQETVVQESSTVEATPTPEPTATPTPTPTATPTPTETPAQETEDVKEPETVEEEPVDDLSARTEALDKTMYAVSAVNVRAGDSTKFEQVSSLSWAQEVKVTGRSTESGWYRINLADGSEGYVSNKYLSESKPQQQKKATQAEAQAAQSGQISQQAAPATTGGGGGLGASRGGVTGVITGTGNASDGDKYAGALAGVNLH